MRSVILAALLLVVAPAYAANTNVSQSHTTFDVDDLEVKAGDTVTFKNDDDVTHNIQVTDSNGGNEDKGLQKPGEDIKESFAKAGTYKIHCAIHPSMKMKVVVK